MKLSATNVFYLIALGIIITIVMTFNRWHYKNFNVLSAVLVSDRKKSIESDVCL